MMFCNLPVLMAQRRLKISKVSADTGISRTTLTQLYYGTGKGIQYETADALCIYFGIGMGDLFSVVPFSFFVEGCTITKGSENYIWEMVFDCRYVDRDHREFPLIDAYFEPEADNDFLRMGLLTIPSLQARNSEKENFLLTKAFHDLSEDGRKHIEKAFSDAFLKACKDRAERLSLTEYDFADVTLPKKFVSRESELTEES